MKVKDLERTANIAWSPANQTPILLAAGTAAQQLDASFNTNAALEIYSLNLTDPGSEMELKGSTTTEHRFHKIVWGAHGSDSGTIVGGCDGGIIQIYNVSKLLKGDNGLVSSQKKHAAPVHSLDFNPFQANLLASGASESEIFIWDMNNTNTPMTPGAKSQPLEDILSIQWNRQVQHILATTFTSKCVVWDLRKNEPIIKLTDTVSRIRWKVVAWHPEVATQLCLASEEDQAPIIQLWDLRFATSPLKTLENHQRGVLSMAWCAQDSDLLISSGKDHRIVCWNPNSNQPGGEVLSEIAKTNQWNFDVIWCPKNPALIATPSFDGHVSVYSLMGGKTQQIQTTNKIADSFPGMDGYIEAPVQQATVPVSVDLSKPPKWLKKPVGARFGFGGKLMTFINDKNQLAQAQQNMQSGQGIPLVIRSVYISQIVTEVDIVNKSAQLEQALEYGNFIEYCRNKADITTDQHKKYIWHFLRANFEENPRIELMNLLGYRADDVNSKLNQVVGKNDIDGLTDGIGNLNSQNNISTAINDFEKISQDYELKMSIKPFKIKTGNDSDGLITEAILMGNVEAAVELCMTAKKYTEAILIAMTGGTDLLAKTQYRYLKQTDSYLSSLISALVAEDWNDVVSNCDINSWKEALTAVLNHCNDDEYPKLCERLGNRLEEESQTTPKFAQDAQLCYICSGSFDKLVGSWSGKAKYSTEDLQELVELIMFLQKAIERQGRSVEVNGKLAELLTQYAFILASQGNLQTALNYLGNSQDQQVAALRDRLYVSLGQKPLYVQRSDQRRTSTRQSFSNYSNQYNTASQFNQNYSQFNTNLVNSTTSQPWQQNTFTQPPAKPFSPAPAAPPPTQPPRPTSVGSTHGGTGLPARSKYVLDPSVQSNTYRTNQFNASPLIPPLPSQPQVFQTNALSNPTMSNPYAPNAIPLNPLIPSTNPFAPNMIPNNTITNVPNPMSTVPTPLVPSSLNSPGPVAPGTGYPAPIQSQPTYQNTGVTNNFSGGEMGQSAINSLPINSAPGWNDPPAYSKSSRTQPKQDFEVQEPITHPLYGTTPVSNIPNNTPFGNQNQMYNPNAMYDQQSTQMYQPPIANSTFNQPNFNTQAISTNSFNQNPINTGYSQPGAPVQGHLEKPQLVEKAPIPEEHIHMQTVFEELRKQCSSASNNPQTRRKLDDVARKLEALYDLLREHKLSPNTLAALHQMVQFIQNGDYPNGLNLHTQLVSGSDFAQIASFMPGLKVLLQCALQLQVYLR